MTTLNNWSVTSGNLYQAPECRRPRLHGVVSGHPEFADGTEVTTSDIMETGGRAARTRSRWYFLGDVDPGYVHWCEENGIDPPTFSEPIRLKGAGG